jgi:type II secretory pathway pseudopilin PulG
MGISEPRQAPRGARRLTRSAAGNQEGFTLAALIIILTIMMVTVAYTVPKMWSNIVKRDRDRQTAFIMRQYARAILAFQKAHGNAYPVTLDQLKEARSPRVIRGRTGEWVDPLTGKVDWILVPPTALNNAGVPGSLDNYNPSATNTAQYGAANQTSTTTPTSTSATGQPNNPADYKGPFVGVRPNKTGDSYLMIRNSDKYEDWIITSQDVKQEADARMAGIQPASGSGPIGGGMPGGSTTPPPAKP